MSPKCINVNVINKNVGLNDKTIQNRCIFTSGFTFGPHSIQWPHDQSLNIIALAAKYHTKWQLCFFPRTIFATFNQQMFW